MKVNEKSCDFVSVTLLELDSNMDNFTFEIDQLNLKNSFYKLQILLYTDSYTLTPVDIWNFTPLPFSLSHKHTHSISLSISIHTFTCLLKNISLFTVYFISLMKCYK